MLEAPVTSEADGRVLIERLEARAASFPPSIRESFLLDSSDGGRWRALTVWNSAAALADYRASVDTPEGVLMFRSVGVEPELGVFDVVVHAAH